MFRLLRKMAPLFLLIDITLIMGAFRTAEWLRNYLGLGMELTQKTTWLSFPVYAAAIGSWLVAFFVVGLHQPSSRYEGIEWKKIPLSGFLGALLFFSVLFFLKVHDFSRLMVTYFLVVSQILIFSRMVLTTLIVKNVSKPFARKVLLIGRGEIGREVALRLQTAPGMNLVESITVDSESLPGLANTSNLEELAPVSQVVRRQQIDDVFVALPAEQHALVEEIILGLQAEPVRIHFVPDVLELTMVRAKVEDFFGIPVVGLREPPFDTAGRVAKRIFDLVVGGALTIMAAPVLGICALAVKYQDGGPAFFCQKRIGENGQPFNMLKFRSMVVNAEEKLKELGISFQSLSQDNPVFKIRNDPRVTKVGRFLRRWSLDELPQLLNVIKGDMSLVGPRPEEVGVVAQYNMAHRHRLAIKPGITGPMQVNGRGDLSLKQRIHLELAYIESWTLWNDIKILIKTIPVIIWGKGAY